MAYDDFAGDNVLKQEAYCFSRYLIGREPSGEMVVRYSNANKKLGLDISPLSDKDVLRFALKHPWAIPFFDAAAGLLQPDSLLRKKIYAMAAVLETSPQYTEYFLPESVSTIMLIFQLISNAFTAGIKILTGIPLLMFIGRGHHD